MKPDAKDQWLLERYRLGELPPAGLAEVAARLDREPGLKAELARLAAADQAYRTAHPAAAEAARIAARLARTEQATPLPRPHRHLLPVAASLLLAVAVGLVVTSLDRGIPDPAGDEVRLKGSVPAAPQLLVFRKNRAGGIDTLAEGNPVHAGDLLQLACRLDRPGYVLIVSWDGAGRVTCHLPAGTAEAPPRLAAGTQRLLPLAFELDAAPGFERFVLVVSDAPFAPADILARAGQLAADGAHARTGRLDLPSEFRQVSVLLPKERS